MFRRPLAVLGDPQTADPCALTDAVALSRFGDTIRETAYGSFSRCDVIVTLRGGAQVDVETRLDKPAPLAGKIEKVEPFRVFPQPRNGDRCVRTVVLADQNRVAITAKLNRGPDSTDLCAMADAATSHAVAVLGRGAVPPASRAG